MSLFHTGLTNPQCYAILKHTMALRVNSTMSFFPFLYHHSASPGLRWHCKYVRRCPNQFLLHIDSGSGFYATGDPFSSLGSTRRAERPVYAWPQPVCSSVAFAYPCRTWKTVFSVTILAMPRSPEPDGYRASFSSFVADTNSRSSPPQMAT